jgi:hypothetical protein
MSFFLILLLSIFPDNSRFGVFNSRIGGENSRFGRQRKFARNGLIWPTIFATKAWLQGKISEVPVSSGKAGNSASQRVKTILLVSAGDTRDT